MFSSGFTDTGSDSFDTVLCASDICQMLPCNSALSVKILFSQRAISYSLNARQYGSCSELLTAHVPYLLECIHFRFVLHGTVYVNS